MFNSNCETSVTESLHNNFLGVYLKQIKSTFVVMKRLPYSVCCCRCVNTRRVVSVAFHFSLFNVLTFELDRGKTQ